MQTVQVLFVLNEDDEAIGTRYYCGEYCRNKALQTTEDAVVKGTEHDVDVLDGTRCEYCGQPVLQ